MARRSDATLDSCSRTGPYYRFVVPPLTRTNLTFGFTHADGDIDVQAFSDSSCSSLVASSTSSSNNESISLENRTSGSMSFYGLTHK